MKNSTHASSRCALTLATAVLCLGSGAVLAQTNTAPAKPPAAATPAAPPVPPKKWETVASVGLSLTRGNSSSLLATLGVQTARKWEKDEVRMGLSGAYGETKAQGASETQKNQELLQGYSQYNRLFTDRFYAGLRVDGQYDGIAGVDYRFKVSPLAGYYLIKTPKTSLSLEMGPTVVFEKFKDQPEDTYMAMRFGERFEHKLTDTTKIWESLEYVPEIDRWTDKYLVTAEVGIDAAISKKVSLRAVFHDIYDSEPANGHLHNELRFVTGIAYKF